MSHQAGSESTNVHEEGIRHLEEYYSEQQDQQREHQDGQEAESQVARLGGEEERTDVHEQQPDQEQEQEHVQEQEQEQVQEQELTLAQHVLEARDQVGSFDEQVEDARRLAIEAAEAALASGAGDFPQLTEHVEEEGKCLAPFSIHLCALRMLNGMRHHRYLNDRNVKQDKNITDNLLASHRLRLYAKRPGLSTTL